MDDMDNPETILELLVSQAGAYGQAPAILAPGRPPLSYAALRNEVDRTGVALAGMGIGRDTRVALSLPNGPETAVLTLSVMVWASCVPLNPSLDRSTCELLLPKLEVDALIASQDADNAAVAVARALGLPVLRLAPRVGGAAGALELHAESDGCPVPRVHPMPGDLALLLHTSGTTSTPKAVPLTHLQVLVRSRTQPIGRDDRCLCVAPLFTGSALGHSLLAPLAAGASIGFTRDASADAIVEAFHERKTTYFSASPAVLSSLVEAPDQRQWSAPGALRYVRSSSSALPAALQQRLESAFGVPVIQGYGATEAGPIAQNPLPPRHRKPGSVGISVGPEIAIIDEQGNFCDRLGNGEVVVRGPGVMSGYADDPKANRNAFHLGWLRTGDRGYLDEDGYLFLTGRLKEVINRGGFKISPTEVDEVLLRHPAVREAAAFAVPHPTLGEDVAAAVVLRERGSATAQQLREYALEHLAPHKVPTTVVPVPSLARNALGKINRGALARHLKDSLRLDFVPPRNVREEQIATVFADALHIERVGAFDNFFALGGDSLSGTQVVGNVNSVFGSNVAADSLFRWPTVAEFAANTIAEPGARRRPPPSIAPRRATRRPRVAAAKKSRK